MYRVRKLTVVTAFSLGYLGTSKSDFQFTARASVKGTAGRNGARHGGRVTLVVTVFEEPYGSAKRPG